MREERIREWLLFAGILLTWTVACVSFMWAIKSEQATQRTQIEYLGRDLGYSMADRQSIHEELKGAITVAVKLDNIGRQLDELGRQFNVHMAKETGQ